MFQKDIEKKIIDLIKKSPIGVTSSEIARYMGISRITITKYLAIIKEKSLIDFKQFGMAKLWFIPVNLNEEIFLRSITNKLANKLFKEDNKEALIDAGKDMGEYFYNLYKEHYNSQELTSEQIIDCIIDAYSKINGKIILKAKEEHKIIFQLNKSPFEEDSADNFIMFNINAGIIGNMVKHISDYIKVSLKPSQDNGIYDMIIFSKRTKESEKADGIEL